MCLGSNRESFDKALKEQIAKEEQSNNQGAANADIDIETETTDSEFEYDLKQQPKLRVNLKYWKYPLIIDIVNTEFGFM